MPDPGVVAGISLVLIILIPIVVGCLFPGKPEPAPHGHNKVVLVGRESCALYVLNRGLSSAGYQIVCARDEDEAIKLTRTDWPDAVIIDGDGLKRHWLELLLVLKLEELQASQAPLVIILAGSKVDVMDVRTEQGRILNAAWMAEGIMPDFFFQNHSVPTRWHQYFAARSL